MSLLHVLGLKKRPTIDPATVSLPKQKGLYLPDKEVRFNLAAYHRLASESLFNPLILRYHALRNVIKNKEIPIYDSTEVSDYLTRTAFIENGSWRWIPLREMDMEDDIPHCVRRYGCVELNGEYFGGIDPRQHYKKMIPHFAMEYVHAIINKGLTDVRFFVATSINEVFLCVTCDSYWDRTPGFDPSLFYPDDPAQLPSPILQYGTPNVSTYVEKREMTINLGTRIVYRPDDPLTYIVLAHWNAGRVYDSVPFPMNG